MTETSCSYGDHRDEALVAFLYEDPLATDGRDPDAMEGSSAERARFERHLRTCARCSADVAALRDVRAQLARWSPPEPGFASATLRSNPQPHRLFDPQSNPQSNPQSAIRNPHWWRLAAAMLFLGVSAGIANLNVRYDRNGLSVRTGWSQGAGGSDRAGGSGGSNVAQGFGPASEAGPASATPWKADLIALESQLKSEIRAAQTSAAAAPAAVRAVPAGDADVTRRVRALVEESEKRQQRELALRLAELLRDVNMQRQADLVKIDRTLGAVQNNVGIEVMKTRQQMNQMDLIYRASQRQ